MHVFATLTDIESGLTTRLMLRPPSFGGGVWHCNVRQERAAYRRLYCDSIANANRVSTSITYRALDRYGYCVNYSIADGE